MSRRLDELMRAADPVDGVDQHSITGDHNDPLYLAILERNQLADTGEEENAPTSTSPGRRARRLTALAAGFIGTVLAIGALLLITPPNTDETPSETSPAAENPPTSVTTIQEPVPTEPGAVVEYLYTVLLDDLDAAVALFAEDAVISISPPPSPGTGTYEGLDAITSLLRKSRAGMESIELTHLEVAGDTVTFNDSVVQRSCFAGPRCVMDTTGHVIEIRDGKIVSWDFGSFETRPVDPDP
jgi:ketosteroid isomerase-like protein